MTLYPPKIENELTPIVITKEEDKILPIYIPFEHSKMISPENYGIQLIYYIYNAANVLLSTGKGNIVDNLLKIELDNNTDLAEKLEKLIGHFIKIQLAYDKTDIADVVLKSNTAIAKITSKPTIKLSNNNGTNIFIGNYITADKTEGPYYYQIDIYQGKDTSPYWSTGQQIHQTDKDESNSYIDYIELSKEIPVQEQFRVIYTVTSLHGLVTQTEPLIWQRGATVDPALEGAKLKLSNVFDEGYVKISLIPGNSKVLSGLFEILRQEKNAIDWEKILRIKLSHTDITKVSWKDFSIEQGKTYKYAIRQIGENNNIVSNMLEGGEVTTDFEDMFIFDGEKQLKLRWNPQVSSFKNNIQEQKIETIGEQYPFIFRNGIIKYKEFPISGLLSYHLDNEELFITKEELGIQENIEQVRTSTKASVIQNQTEGAEYAAERAFKLKVQDWLNNGTPKLFKSPTEGNYVVYISAVSLSPFEGTGRLLHIIQGTAYEIAGYSYDSLRAYNFLTDEIIKEKQTLQWETVNLNDYKHFPHLLNRMGLSPQFISDCTVGTKQWKKAENITTENTVLPYIEYTLKADSFEQNVEAAHFDIEFAAPNKENANQLSEVKNDVFNTLKNEDYKYIKITFSQNYADSALLDYGVWFGFTDYYIRKKDKTSNMYLASNDKQEAILYSRLYQNSKREDSTFGMLPLGKVNQINSVILPIDKNEPEFRKFWRGIGDLNVEWIEGKNLMASHELNDKGQYVRTNAIDYIKDEAKITRIRLKPFSKQEVRGYTYTFRIYNISFYKSKEDAELWKANQLGREFEDYIDSTTGLVVDLKDSLNKNWYKIGKDKYDLRSLTTDKNRMQCLNTDHPAESILLQDMKPGSQLLLRNQGETESSTIYIGKTGSLGLPFETIDKARISVPIEKMGEIGGQMTYSYYGSNIKSEIEQIKSLQYYPPIIEQFRSHNHDSEYQEQRPENIIEALEKKGNESRQILYFYYVRIHKKEIIDLRDNENGTYSLINYPDAEPLTNEENPETNTWGPFSDINLYRVHKMNNNKTEIYQSIRGWLKTKDPINTDLYKYWINQQGELNYMDLSLDKTGEYVITKPQIITYLKISPGLIIDFIYDYNIPIKEGVEFNDL